MQTFLPYEDYYKSASCLDKKRQFCEVKETYQILDILERRKKWYSGIGREGTPSHQKSTTMPSPADSAYDYLSIEAMPSIQQMEGMPANCCGSNKFFIKMPGWINHTAVLMWVNYEEALKEYYNVFWQYAVDVHKVKMKKMTLKKTSSLHIDKPHWLGYPEVHITHRGRLLAKKPEHYNQFGWTEKPIEDSSGYYWPCVNDNGIVKLKPEVETWYGRH